MGKKPIADWPQLLILSKLICKDSKRPFPHLLVYAAVVGWEGVITNCKFEQTTWTTFQAVSYHCFSFFCVDVLLFLNNNTLFYSISFQNYNIHMFELIAFYKALILCSCDPALNLPKKIFSNIFLSVAFSSLLIPLQCSI